MVPSDRALATSDLHL